MARPTNDPKPALMTVRLSEDDRRTLARLASVGGCSPSEALRRLLRGHNGAKAASNPALAERKTGRPALNARRGDLFYIDYDDPNVIVELNTDNDHSLYDPRVELPGARELVDSIKMRGQEVPAE